jgi:hypothetical protein
VHYVAIAGDIAVAGAKFLVAAVTDSSAMLTEGAHSLVDTGNELLLLHGARRSQRAVGEWHPFGYGKTTWNYVVLAIAAVFQGLSWRASRQELDRHHRVGETLWHASQRDMDVLVFTVFVEDSAALIGVTIAALRVWPSHALQNPYLDPQPRWPSGSYSSRRPRCWPGRAPVCWSVPASIASKSRSCARSSVLIRSSKA